MNVQTLQVSDSKTTQIMSISDSLKEFDQLTTQRKSKEALELIRSLLKDNPQDPQILVRYARGLYMANQAKEAEDVYNGLVARKHTLEVDDARLFAICCAQNGHIQDAERHFRSLLKRFPKDHLTVENLLRFYLTLKRYDESIGLFVQIAILDKMSTKLVEHIRKTLRKHGELKRLLAFNGVIMSFFPRDRLSFFDSARVQMDLGVRASAKLLARDAVSIPEISVEGVEEFQGVIAAQENNFVEAEEKLLKALKKKPDHLPLVINVAKLLVRTRQYSKAASLIEPHIEKNFANNNDFQDLVIQVFGHDGQSERAMICARSVYDKDPARTRNIDVMGMAYLASRRYEEGIAFLNKQLKRYGQPPSKLFHRYIAFLMQDCQHQRALEELEVYINKNPKDIRAAMQAAFAALNVNEFEKGWKYYDRRLEMKDKGKYFVRHEGKEWQGEDISNKRVLLVSEQGLGDVLMATRFIQKLRGMCKELIFEVQSPLIKLLRANFSDISFYARGQKLPEFDCQIQMMSLFSKLDIRPETMTGRKGYLVWDGEYDFPRQKKFTVAFCWQGEANHPNDINRSFMLEHLEPLFQYRDQVQFVSIQRGYHEDHLDRYPWTEGTIKLGNKLNDFTDTAALLRKIDLVICCDSAPIHLAGSMGKPAWCLVNTPCEWRWTQNGEKNYWYDYVRILRVSKDDYSWKTTLGRAAADLGVLLKRGGKVRI